ncbi:MAG: transposase [Halioglobus sp.]
MPRTARVIAPGLPHHIVQRGHDRRAVFFEDEDYLYYLSALQEWKTKLGLRVYAWCLMTNHVHLIVNPGEDCAGIPRLMKRLAGRQTRYVNKLRKRSGTLWDGRYKSSPIETDVYLLQCCRYVELNPVKARMVGRAEDYRWSTYRSKIGLEQSSILDLDPCYLRLSVPERSYRQFVEEGISEQEQSFIQNRVRRNGLTGTSQFVEEVEERTGIRIESRPQGRPRKLAK